MATQWTQTRQQVGEAVMRKLGVLAAGETASVEDTHVVYTAMDGVLKSLHHMGVLWWRVTGASTDLVLTVGTAAVGLPVDLLFPVAVTVAGNPEQPVSLIGHLAWRSIARQAATGKPEVAWFDQSSAQLHLWPTPKSADTLRLTYQRIANDTATGTVPDVPQWALILLRDLVAYRVADDFGLPEDRIVRFAAEAREAERLIRIMNAPRVDTRPVRFSNH